MFPIKNHSGNIIGFGGRTIDDSLPKYLIQKIVPFSINQESFMDLTILNKITKVIILLLQRDMDVIMLSQHDVNNAVASLGTAFSLAHLQNLFKLEKNSFLF